MLRAAQRSGDRMMRLIVEMLDLEKIKGGMMPIEATVTPLMDLFEHASQAVPIKSGADAVTIEIVPTEQIVECDPHRMMQVLVNLLSNAVKFSPPGGKVVLSGRREGATVVISVKDQGRGIPEEQIVAIFEPFQQVETTDATMKGGTGLGLAICRGIVELHGGTIKVESKIGEGSDFLVILPLSAEAVRAQEMLAADAP
jgi:signal transduction histidine kinase